MGLETEGEGRAVASEQPAGNARTLAGPAGGQAPVFVGLIFVSSKFVSDHRFLLQVVHTKKGSSFLAPAGCSLELFRKLDSVVWLFFFLPRPPSSTVVP